MDPNFTCKFDPTVRDSFFPKDIDTFKCGLATMMLILYNINFGHICGGFLLLLAIISIFGGIKEHYRWFILNQVIWDALMTYRFICDSYVARFFYKRKACHMNEVTGSLIGDIPHASYSALLLLTFSRFLCLYHKHFYETLTKNYRIFVTIFIYNFIMVVTTTPGIFLMLQKQTVVNQYCAKLPDDERALCTVSPPMDAAPTFLTILTKIEIFLSLIKPPACLFLSIFSTFMLILKISKQFKFQRKNNVKDFHVSLRITIVIAFQTLLYSFIFCLEIVTDFMFILIDVFDSNIRYAESLPSWYGGKLGLSFPPMVHNFVQIRIFIESLIILFVMSGYREAVIRFFKCVFSCVRFKNNNGRSKTPVTVMLENANQKTRTSLK